MGQLSGGSFAKILTATTWQTVMMSTSALMPTVMMIVIVSIMQRILTVNKLWRLLVRF